MKRLFLFTTCVAAGYIAGAQMVIQSGATLHIESGAKVTLQGDLTSSANIQGPGTVQMKGTAAQNINMNGFTIPNLEIDNTANVTLTGITRVGNNLLFTGGKLQTGAADLLIAPAATITGANASRFIWTSGAGQVKKELTADVTNFELPVGENSSYRPVYLTSTGGTYSSAVVGVRNVSGTSANKPPMMANFLSSYWPVTKSGITGGIQTITGQYNEPTDISGTEASLSGYFFNGTDWTSVNASQDNGANRVTAPIVSASGELTGMNKFVAVGARSFLQGAYNTANGLMTDGLRAGTNLIPTSDPYRSAPYNTNFTHVNNTIPEATSATVFANQASINDDIVDWVFLELRNTASPGNTVLQTRSAFIQRDGDIVDIDGVSPVTFNNTVGGGYTIAVRHRNHLGLATAPTSPRTFSEARSIAFTTNAVDLRTDLASTVFGTAYTSATHPTLGAVRLNYGGDASGNGIVRYINPGNDKDAIISAIGGVLTGSLINVYRREDLNMNRQVRYINPGNDKDFLLTTIGGIQTGARVQALPN